MICEQGRLDRLNIFLLCDQGAGELFGAAVLSIRRAGMVASLILMLFLLTGGYYVQVSNPFFSMSSMKNNKI